MKRQAVVIQGDAEIRGTRNRYGPDVATVGGEDGLVELFARLFSLKSDDMGSFGRDGVVLGRVRVTVELIPPDGHYELALQADRGDQDAQLELYGRAEALGLGRLTLDEAPTWKDVASAVGRTEARLKTQREGEVAADDPARGVK